MEKIKGQLESYKEQPFSLVLRFLMWIATFLTVGITVCIVGYILIRGIPNLSPEMFAWEYNTENVSMMPAIINTVLMVLLVLLIAVPVGIGAAIYLVEYAKRGSKLVKLVGSQRKRFPEFHRSSMVCSVICYLQQHSDGVIPSWEVRSLWRL